MRLQQPLELPKSRNCFCSSGERAVDPISTPITKGPEQP